MALSEMVQEFDIKDLHKSGAVFDIEKLRWFNRRYLQKIPGDEFAGLALGIMEAVVLERGSHWDADIGARLLGIVRERISVIDDIRALADDGEFDYFFTKPGLIKNEIPGKGGQNDTAAEHLLRIHELLSASDDAIFIEPERIKGVVWDYATEKGRGAVLWPMRYALSGRARSPDPFVISSIIGKDETLARINIARTALL